MRLIRAVLFSLSLAGTALSSGADACGGCFHGPPTVPQVVTDHRMVLSLASGQTTLWDQFQYSGSAEDFSWILPIRYTERTRVEVGSDAFMTMMDQATTPSLTYPTPPGLAPDCQPPPQNGFFADAASGGAWDAAQDSGVTVLREEVVGPYAVAIVRGASGMGLREWLRMNGYVVPAAMEPVIDHYLALNMDFVALRLRAGKGVQRMVPVRVTVDGYQPRLPLRMVAAGVADRVGLSLIVVAESRIEAANFPNGEIRDAELTYDWNNPRGVSGDVLRDEFTARNRAAGERLWLTWVSEPRSFLELESAAAFAEAGAPVRGADGGFLPPPRVDAGDVGDAGDAGDGGDAGEGRRGRSPSKTCASRSARSPRRASPAFAPTSPPACSTATLSSPPATAGCACGPTTSAASSTAASSPPARGRRTATPARPARPRRPAPITPPRRPSSALRSRASPSPGTAAAPPASDTRGYTLVNRRTIHWRFGTATLSFCGVAPVHFTTVHGVRAMDARA
jgi:hypothetical protein